jgi:hypothetical protein
MATGNVCNHWLCSEQSLPKIEKQKLTLCSDPFRFCAKKQQKYYFEEHFAAMYKLRQYFDFFSIPSGY